MADLTKSMNSGLLGNIGTGMGIASSILDTRARRRQGEQGQIAAYHDARQLDTNAGEAAAAGQRKAAEERRRAQLVQSRALALAAAGGGAADPSVVDIVSDIEGEGAYRALAAMYEGEDRARSFRNAAAARRYEGDVSKATGRGSPFSTILRGGATLFSKYGNGGPPKTSSVGALDRYDLGNVDDPRYG